MMFFLWTRHIARAYSQSRNMTKGKANVRVLRQALKVWRRRSGKTDTDLARAIGVDSSFLSSVQSGRRGWSMSVALAVHRETGIPIEKLLGHADLQVLRDYLAVAKEDASISQGNL